jgi:hypothetical protein
MTKEFVPYELAFKLIYELGFKEKCLATIDEIGYLHIKGTKSSPRGAILYAIIDCPTFSQAFRWFREEHGLFGNPDISNFENKTYGYAVTTLNHPHYLFNAHSFSSMEEAELACLGKLIEILTKQQEQ